MIRLLTSKFHAWRQFQVAVRELSRLSDRELSDLGLGRADIADVARDATRLQGAR